MTRRINMVGQKYGKLTVVRESGKDHRGYRYECKCDCGGVALNVAGTDLRCGRKTSCGCRFGERRKTHGMSGTRQYYIWSNMKRRCDEPSNKEYHCYGGKGVTYCEGWKDFSNFWADMKDGYAEHLTLDRINVDGNYSKDNCRWATLKEQENNRTNNLVLNYRGQNLTLAQIANITGTNYSSINNRLRRGMSIEDATSIPFQEQITFNGVTKSVKEYARATGMTYHQLKKRLMRGWSVERALTQPLRKRA